MRVLILPAISALVSCTPAEQPQGNPTPAPSASSSVAALASMAPVASAPPTPSALSTATAPSPEPSPTPSSPSTETGYLERRADGTCTWNFSEYCCPPRAMCKPTPPAKPVACPPLAPVKDAKPTDSDDAYKERRVDGRCWSGPNPRTLHRTLCCNERYSQP